MEMTETTRIALPMRLMLSFTLRGEADLVFGPWEQCMPGCEASCIPGSVAPVQLQLFCLLGLPNVSQVLLSFAPKQRTRAGGMFHTMERPRPLAHWAGFFLSIVLLFLFSLFHVLTFSLCYF